MRGGSIINDVKYDVSSIQGKREYMEDTYSMMDFVIGGNKCKLFGVFDGHGGDKVSKRLSDNKDGLFPFLINRLTNKSSNVSVIELLRTSFLDFDLMLLNDKYKDGSTAIVVLMIENDIYMINLGDSRGMIISSNENMNIYNGKLSYLCSNDHKPWKDNEKRRIFLAGYFVSPFKIYDSINAKKIFQSGDIVNNNNKYMMYWGNKWDTLSNQQTDEIKLINEKSDVHRVANSLALSRSFGDFYLKKNTKDQYMSIDAAVSPEPDIYQTKLINGMSIILASDGFWDVAINNIGFRNKIRSTNNIKSLCDEFVNSSIKSGDNITVMIIKT